MARVRSIASLSLALPGLERCDRPRQASLRASGVQPGRLAQGPDEKNGRAGRTAGRLPVMIHSFQNERAPLGERGPGRCVAAAGGSVKLALGSKYQTSGRKKSFGFRDEIARHL